MKKILSIFLLAGLFWGCSGKQTDVDKCYPCDDMPAGATDIDIIDRHWVKFTFDGDRYLMYRKTNQAAITKISE